MITGRKIRIGVAASIAATMMTGSALAQDTVGCDLVPLELPLFGGTPVAAFATPSPVASPAAVTLGDEEAREVLEQYVACTNTGDPTLVWAMFTPRWFSQTFADPEEHYLPAFEQMLDQEVQPAGMPLELVEIVGISPGDASVEVTATFRSGDQEWTDTVILVSIDGQWLIDDVRLDEPLP